MFTKLEEDLLEFKFVIFEAFGVEYNNQTRFCSFSYKGTLVRCLVPAVLVQPILGLEGALGKLRKSADALG